MGDITAPYSKAGGAEETQTLLSSHEKKETLPSNLSVTIDVSQRTNRPPNWIDFTAGDPGCKRACSHCLFNVGPWVIWVSALCIGGGIRGMIELHYSTHYGNTTNVIVAAVALAVLIIIYIVAVLYSETWGKVFGAISKGQLEKKLQVVHQSAPKITWHMQCYHNDDSQVEIIYSNGSTGVQAINTKIVTWSGTKTFDFRSWKDVTHPLQLAESGSYQIISMHKEYIFADEGTRKAYEAQKQAFINDNQHRDVSYTIRESFELDGFHDSFLSACHCTGSVIVYLVMTLLLLAYHWSFLVKKGERRLDYHCVKMVSARHGNISIAHVALPQDDLMACGPESEAG